MPKNSENFEDKRKRNEEKDRLFYETFCENKFY